MIKKTVIIIKTCVLPYSLLCVMGVFLISSDAGAVNELAAKCDEKWVQLPSNQNTGSGYDHKKLLADWLLLKPECKGTGIYEVRLAATYLMLNDKEKARESLISVDIPREYLPLASTVELNLDLVEALTEEFINPEKILPVEEKGLKLLKEYPDHLPLYSMVGHLKVILEKYSEAVPILEKAIQYKDGDLLGPYRNLGIAYAYTGEYEEAVGALDYAYQLNKNITSDEEYMYGLAISYAALGGVKDAEDVLNLILNKKPYIKNDIKFKEAIDIITNKITKKE
jgi:tetratricopeptide (TPR) repeat protein